MSKFIFFIISHFFIYLFNFFSQLSFPSFVKDRDFKNLMQLMLNKNHLSRYSKLSQINSHIWFQNFNWDDLISMNMKPAFLPKLKSKELNNKPVPYLDFVKTCPEWEEPPDQVLPTEENKKEFKEWLKRF